MPDSIQVLQEALYGAKQVSVRLLGNYHDHYHVQALSIGCM